MTHITLGHCDPVVRGYPNILKLFFAATFSVSIKSFSWWICISLRVVSYDPVRAAPSRFVRKGASERDRLSMYVVAFHDFGQQALLFLEAGPV